MLSVTKRLEDDEEPSLHPCKCPRGLYATFFGPVLTLANSTLGAGVLSYPYAFRECGWLLGSFLCVMLGAILALSCWVLAYCCTEVSPCTPAQMLRSTEQSNPSQAQKTNRAVRSYHQLVELVGGSRYTPCCHSAHVGMLGCAACRVLTHAPRLRLCILISSSSSASLPDCRWWWRP